MSISQRAHRPSLACSASLSLFNGKGKSNLVNVLIFMTTITLAYVIYRCWIYKRKEKKRHIIEPSQ